MGNPFLGVFFHWLGGLASGSFYVPFKGVRKWSWETYWLVGGFFSWIIAPTLLALLLTRHLFEVLGQQAGGTLWWTYFFGVLWGFGGLTFGLAMRYLGMSLGMGVALGFCALLPPVCKLFAPAIPVDETIVQIAATPSGQVTLLGVFCCLAGIGIAALAGLSKEREMSAGQKQTAIAEFSFNKGILVATFSGVMSACFAFGLTAGNPIDRTTALAGTSTLWTGLPKLVIVLLGGFTTNFIWCVLLNIKNRSGHEYFDSRFRPHLPGTTLILENAIDAPSEEIVKHSAPVPGDDSATVPMAANYFFSALAGTIWYFQFFFYTMGQTQMGKFEFASWTLHMASIIIFSTLWGVYFQEWKGGSRKTIALITGGIGTLVLSTVIIGVGAWIKSRPGGR
jgi:L-rhamnose-H+ transport protein